MGDNNNKAEKILPQNTDAEAAVISACLINDKSVCISVSRITPEYFYKNAHKLIFKAIKQLFDKGTAVDIITLKSQLEKNDNLNDAGGLSYLSEVSDILLSDHNLMYYIDAVKREYLKRQIMHIGRGIIDEAFEPGANPQDIMHSAENRLFNLFIKEKQGRPRVVSDIVPEVINEIDERVKNKVSIRGISTSIYALDSLIDGLKKENLVYVGGRTAMGKTLLLQQIAIEAARTGKYVLFISIEMPEQELVQRLIAYEAEVDFKLLHSGYCQKESFEKISGAVERIADMNLCIDDSTGITVSHIKSSCQQYAIEHGKIDLIIIDYLQLIYADERKESRNQEVGSVSRKLKELAKQLKCPVVCAAQLNRSLEARADKRPSLSDLRDSGEIEQDADAVVFLYRDDYYNKDGEKNGLVELIVAKNRHGETGTVEAFFCPHISKIKNK